MPSCYLTCPAYAVVDAQQLAEAVGQAESVCRELGWELVSSPLMQRFAGPGDWLPLADRVQDWSRGAEHDVLWAFRGGYGALELALALDRNMSARPAMLIGYSDITALHLGRQSAGLYAPVCNQPLQIRSRASLLDQCRGLGASWDARALPHVRSLRSGSVSAPLVAACLRLLTACTGTPLQPDLTGQILAIEDIGERPYAVDRDLTQLAAAGVLDGIVGLVGSSFPHEAPAGYAGPDIDTILGRWAERLGIPAIIGLPFGHDPDPITLAQDRPTELSVAGSDWHLVQAPSN